MNIMSRAAQLRCVLLCSAFMLVSSTGCSLMRGNKPTVEDIEKSAAVMPTTESLKSAGANIQYALAKNAEQNDVIDEAIAAYKKALSVDPTMHQAYHRLGNLYDKQGDSSTAVQYYSEALKLAPENSEIHCDWGYNCYLRNQWEEAETHYFTSLNLQPEFKRAHNNLGLLYARQGRLDEALVEFSRAGASESEARSNVAFAMMLDGQLQTAQQQLQLAQTNSPRTTPQVAQLQRIAEIAASPEGIQTASRPLSFR